MEEKRFTFVRRYLTIKTKADCEIWCKEGRDKKITVTDTDNGECFIFMRKDFLYSHSDTLITMCHLLFKGENLESLEIEESDFLPNLTTKEEFMEHKQNNIENFEKNEENHREFKNLIEKNNYEEKTWSELKILRENAKLEKGKWYRITDYNCVVNSTIATIKSGNHNYDILVLATDTNRLSEKALATKHDGDTYFQYCNLEAWELKYCLDNDQTRFPWCGSDTDNGKGVVWWLKDEYENEAFYDFKNVMEQRYEITKIRSFSACRIFTNVTSIRNITATIDTTTLWYFYTFSFFSGADELTQNKILDLSVQNIKTVYNNKLSNRFFINGKTTDFSINCFLAFGKENNILDLSNIEIRDNKLGNKSWGNTFNCNSFRGSIVYENTFGQENYNNTIISAFFENFIKNTNYENVFCNSTQNNFLGSGNYYNFFENINDNVFGNNNQYLTLYSCRKCHIGDFNFSINAYEYIYDFYIGNNNDTISVNSDSSYMASSKKGSIGNNNKNISIGKGSDFNSIGNYNSYIDIMNESKYNSLGNGNQYIKIGSTTTCTGCFIGNNIQGTSDSYRKIDGQTNQQIWS